MFLGAAKKDGTGTSPGFSRPDRLLVSEFKEALRRPSCPLCRLARNADRYYLKVFLREGKDDGRMLLRLLGSWGLCARHGPALVHLEPVERGDGLSTGTLYDWLLDQARRLLEDLRRILEADDGAEAPYWRRASRRHIDRAVLRLSRTGRCPACEAQEQYMVYVTGEFARALELAEEPPEIRDMCLASEGLCLPHWRAVEPLLSSPDTRALVAERQRRMVASLKAALDSELACGAAGEVHQGEAEERVAVAMALAVVAGDTAWQP